MGNRGLDSFCGLGVGDNIRSKNTTKSTFNQLILESMSIRKFLRDKMDDVRCPFKNWSSIGICWYSFVWTTVRAVILEHIVYLPEFYVEYYSSVVESYYWCRDEWRTLLFCCCLPSPPTLLNRIPMDDEEYQRLCFSWRKLELVANILLCNLGTDFLLEKD